tara:strand:+ start:45 stop:209 length:165 start_codon:yes stop_codon:yes gene_type:complete
MAVRPAPVRGHLTGAVLGGAAISAYRFLLTGFIEWAASVKFDLLDASAARLDAV